MKRFSCLLLILILLASFAPAVAEVPAGDAGAEATVEPGAAAVNLDADAEPANLDADAETTADLDADATAANLDADAATTADLDADAAVADLDADPGEGQEVVLDEALDPEAVKCLQIDLIGRGYLEGEADGLMGPATISAIRAAQADLGLEVNGLMSDELSAALATDAFPLTLGSRSSVVYQIQKPLYRWGFLEEEPTGYYGEATQSAVALFQSIAIDDFSARKQSESDAAYAAMTVPDDVAVDQPLYNEATIPCDGVMTQEWYDYLINDFTVPKITAGPEDEGNDVKMVQRRLHALGYMYSGMDGTYGSSTELALKYFQRKSGLPETGVCDEATSVALFSEDALESEEYVMPYMAYVKRSESRVYIFGWDGEGYNTKVKAFKCSCGAKGTPTIKGTYYCEGPISEWYYMAKSAVWVRYAFKIKGNYFFHSVLYKRRGGSPTSTSVHNLGRNVSHGCIRLAVDDVKWIYENCPAGMKVVIE